MQRLKLFTLTAIIATMLVACKSSPEGDEAKTTDAKEVETATAGVTMNINTIESKLEWIGTKVTSHHNGTVNIKSGQLMAKGNELTGGYFVIDMPTLISVKDDPQSNSKLTGHLKSPDFFDVEKYPEAKFEITSVKPFSGSVVDENTVGQEEINEYKVTDPNVIVNGNLTIKDVTKNIEFPAKVNITGNGATALAKFNINRKDWGVNYTGAPDNLVRDEIWFGVSIAANK
ncbi:MAG: YceI family protein [Fimbriimonadaceae bacterium]|nr:YceI family protein [Chitinophagales bacterium]